MSFWQGFAIYALIAVLTACINSYRKGCAVKKAGGWMGWRNESNWDCLIFSGSMAWPVLVVYAALMPLKYISTIPYKLGLKHGCPGKK